MLNTIWAVMIFAGVITALFTGRTTEISEAVLASCVSSIQLIITMLGAMCLWSGVMRVAQKAGLVDGLAKLLRGVFRYFFPGIPKDHPANGAIAMSLSADLLGLGSAATPLGIMAMRELSNLNGNSTTASNAMVMFGVLNSVCIQLIPASVLVIRQQAGSVNPSAIIPAVWATSLISATTGVIATKLLEKRGL